LSPAGLFLALAARFENVLICWADAGANHAIDESKAKKITKLTRRLAAKRSCGIADLTRRHHWHFATKSRQVVHLHRATVSRLDPVSVTAS
jgi:hypothetical protein